MSRLDDNLFGPVYDQGRVGSCMVCAFCTTFVYLFNKHSEKQGFVDKLLNRVFHVIKGSNFGLTRLKPILELIKSSYLPDPFFPSRYNLYYYSCVNRYNPSSRSDNGGGTDIQHIINDSVNIHGIFSELNEEKDIVGMKSSFVWLYDNIDTDPTTYFTEDKQRETAKEWNNCITFEEDVYPSGPVNRENIINKIKNSIDNHIPVIITTNYSVDLQTDKLKGVNNDRTREECTITVQNIVPNVAGHAMVIVGYNENSFEIQNSKGTMWGYQSTGRFWLHFDSLDCSTAEHKFIFLVIDFTKLSDRYIMPPPKTKSKRIKK